MIFQNNIKSLVRWKCNLSTESIITRVIGNLSTESIITWVIYTTKQDRTFNIAKLTCMVCMVNCAIVKRERFEWFACFVYFVLVNNWELCIKQFVCMEVSRTFKTASNVVDRGFESQSGKIKDYQINSCCFSSNRVTLRRERERERESNLASSDSGYV